MPMSAWEESAQAQVLHMSHMQVYRKKAAGIRQECKAARHMLYDTIS